MKAEEIKALRGRLGINQVQLAGLMGVHPFTVSRWERGLATPTLYQAEILDGIAKRKHPKRFNVAALLMKYPPFRVLTTKLLPR